MTPRPDPLKVTMMITHDPCTDGFGSRFAAELQLGDKVIYVPGRYGDKEIPNVQGHHVVIADFSYSYDILCNMLKQCASLIVLDHHESAKNDLIAIPDENKIFDMNKSGAVLAWEFFHPNEEVPLLFQYIMDRDLFTFKLNKSREFSAAMYMVPFQFKAFKEILDGGITSINIMIEKGTAILDYQQKMIEQQLKGAEFKKLVQFPLWNCAIINFGSLQSEIGNEACIRGLMRSNSSVRIDMAFIWQWKYDTIQKKERLVVSLRSNSDDVDVSIVAKTLFNSGGHKRAAAGICDSIQAFYDHFS